MASGPAGGSEDAMLAQAAALEDAAARRYEALAAWWAAQGDGALAAVFDRLGRMEREHAVQAEARRPGPAVAPEPAAGETAAPEEEGWRSALLTPYRALSFAVRAEERAFAHYATMAAHAPTPRLRALAEALARAELEHAAILRRARRAAFHSERAPPPPPADLPALQRQSAAWEADAAAAATRAGRLRALSRNAERYLEIAERTRDEAVLTAAQRLAAQTLRRLALLRGEASGPA
jgi:rubrerythrin